MARAARDATRPVRATRRVPPEPQARRRFRVPTSIIVTLVGAILTVLILPAVTRQWDDRQRARELKAALVEQVSTATATQLNEALVRPKASIFELGLNYEWNLARLRIDAKIGTYFPSLRAHWQRHAAAVTATILLFRATRNADWRTADTVDAYLREIAGVSDNVREIPRRFRRTVDFLLSDDEFWRKTGRSILADTLVEGMNQKGGILRAIQSTNPEGFSVTRRDLIRDILPGI